MSSSSSHFQRCSIPGCRSNYDRSSEPVETFPLPRAEGFRKVWLRYIPAELHHLEPVVCVKHFARSSLMSGSALLVNGEVTLYQKVKLKPNAFPTIFPRLLGPDMVVYPREAYQGEQSYSRNWQGGNVVLAQGSSAGVSSNSIDLPQNPQGLPSALSNPSMRGPPLPGGFIPISEQIRAQNNRFQNMYMANYQPKIMPMNNLPAQATPPALPIYPEVRFKRLPFYDILGDLLKPSTLTAINSGAREPTANYVFFLTPRQASDVSMNREVGPGTRNEYSIQIQMRFCLLDTSCEQEDLFPPGCAVKINGKVAPLPNPVQSNKQGAEPKRPSRPLNISHLVKLCPSVSNNVAITWTPDYQRGYVVMINLVRKLSSMDLLERLKQKGVRHADYTTGLIKDKLNDSDNDIATTSLRVSLTCPLGKMRMQTPVRSSTCSHLQCFDGGVFLSMNEKRPTWTCPVCNKPAIYDNLVIDGYFQNVLDSPLLGDCNEIQLNKDGSWSAHDESQELAAQAASKAVDSPKDDQIEEIKDDDEEENGGGEAMQNGDSKPATTSEKPAESAPAKEKDMVVVDLTETDDEEPAPPPPAKATTPLPTIPPIAKLDQLYSDSTSSMSTTTRSPPSIINLDSPSPSPSPPRGTLPGYNLPSAPGVSPPSSYMCHMRLAPDSRYHPY